MAETVFVFSLLGSMSIPRCTIADDIRSSRELLRRCVNDIGIACDAFCDGQAAWEAMATRIPTIVISDIEMPRMNGLQLLHSIRSSSEIMLATIPVVLVTSLVDRQLLEVAERFGATALIHKPISATNVKHVVKRLVNGQTVPFDIDSPSDIDKKTGVRGNISPALRRLLLWTRDE